MSQPEAIFWLTVAMLGVVVLGTLPLAIINVTARRGWVKARRRLSLWTETAALEADTTDDFIPVFARLCAAFGRTYQVYLNETNPVSDEQFREWLITGLGPRDLPPPIDPKKRIWGLWADTVKDNERMVKHLAVKMKEMVESELKTVDYLVGLTPIGEMLAVFLTMHSKHGVVLPFNMMPVGCPQIQTKRPHIMVVDAVVNQGQQMARCNEWQKTWFQDPEITIVVGVNNNLVERNIESAMDILSKAKLKQVVDISTILSWLTNGNTPKNWKTVHHHEGLPHSG